jgi:hypothetical protein
MGQSEAVAVVEKTRRNRWLDITLTVVVVLLFVGLRSWSTLWRYRWTGLLLGLALALFVLQRRQPSYDIAKRHDIPNRVYLVGIVVFIAMGATALRRFFLGGTGDDGFFGVVGLALAIHWTFVYRWLSSRGKPGIRVEDH